MNITLFYDQLHVDAKASWICPIFGRKNGTQKLPAGHSNMTVEPKLFVVPAERKRPKVATYFKYFRHVLGNDPSKSFGSTISLSTFMLEGYGATGDKA